MWDIYMLQWSLQYVTDYTGQPVLLFQTSLMCKFPQIQAYLAISVALLQRISQMNYKWQWCNEWQEMKQKKGVEGNEQQSQIRSVSLHICISGELTHPDSA